ncbi:hypothetical protein ACGF5O_27870 [Streptomyces sp. NPDC048291]|uniref:hypothetical protein n=1 Tax=Streptomyces sp. NPDC048291 TaxID=3365530 RepID=UPI003723CF25
MRTSHYAGNTWVDDVTSEPDWGVDSVATVTLPVSAGLTKDTWSARDHTVQVRAQGLTVSTTVNGVEIDSRTLTGDQIRSLAFYICHPRPSTTSAPRSTRYAARCRRNGIAGRTGGPSSR